MGKLVGKGVSKSYTRRQVGVRDSRCDVRGTFWFVFVEAGVRYLLLSTVYFINFIRIVSDL